MTIIREALDHELYHQFTFGDAARSPAVVGKIGGQHLGGMLGTAVWRDNQDENRATIRMRIDVATRPRVT